MLILAYYRKNFHKMHKYNLLIYINLDRKLSAAIYASKYT